MYDFGGEFGLGTYWYGDPAPALAACGTVAINVLAAPLEDSPGWYEIFTPGTDDELYGGVDVITQELIDQLDILREEGLGRP